VAKTDAELLDYFKQIAARNDWTVNDFQSSRREVHDFIEQIDTIFRMIGHINTASDVYLNALLTRLNQARNVVNNEISRRAV